MQFAGGARPAIRSGDLEDWLREKEPGHVLLDQDRGCAATAQLFPAGSAPRFAALCPHYGKWCYQFGPIFKRLNSHRVCPQDAVIAAVNGPGLGENTRLPAILPAIGMQASFEQPRHYPRTGARRLAADPRDGQSPPFQPPDQTRRRHRAAPQARRPDRHVAFN